MAQRDRRRGGNIFLMVVRMLGLIGLFAAAYGGLLLAALPWTDWPALGEALQKDPGEVWRRMLDPGGRRIDQIGLWGLLAGGAVALVALGVQLLVGLFTLAGGRNLSRANAVVQSVLAVALLVLVNIISWLYPVRWDLTGRAFSWNGFYPVLQNSERFEQKFTLPKHLVEELKKLRGQTTIVVYLRHRGENQLTERPDAYEFAAARKVVEKVHDLVQLFRELGPQFRVEVLDVEKQDYDQKFARLTGQSPELARAISAAPENSIFFHAVRTAKGPDGKAQRRESVQRLAFREFYQLDRGRSRDADNLVLLPQGIDLFARRVLAIEEKRPRIGVAVIHEWLTSVGLNEFSLAGMKKVLEDAGLDVVDIVLKKGWGEEGEPSPAAYTLGEAQLERLEEELALVQAVLDTNRAEYLTMSNILEKLKSSRTLEQLNRELAPMLGGRRMDERSRKINILNLEPQLNFLKEVIAEQEKERAEVIAQLEALPQQERVREDRRLTDVKAKLTKLARECDLLIVPRMTLRNVLIGDVIPPRLHRLDEAQIAAVKDFLKSGKPVLASFGPNIDPPSRRSFAPSGRDEFEALFGQLGIVFGNQAVLYGAEQKSFAERRSNLLGGAAEPKVPPVLFTVADPVRARGGKIVTDDVGREGARPNPVAESLKVVAAGVGSPEKLRELILRHPRPVYFVPVRGGLDFAAEFLYSDPDSWNEESPFPTREQTPRFEPTKPDHPNYGTRDAEQRGPFPLAVAVETTVPAAWLRDDVAAAHGLNLILSGAPGDAGWVAANALVPADAFAPADFRPVPLRVAAVGHGGWMVGPELKPATAQLLVNLTNWLLARDGRLPRADLPAWQYPRLDMDDTEKRLWTFGVQWALPGLFAFLGAWMTLVRRYR